MVNRARYSNCGCGVPNVRWIEENPVRGNIMRSICLGVFFAVGAVTGVASEIRKPVDWFSSELKAALRDVRASMKQWDDENLSTRN